MRLSVLSVILLRLVVFLAAFPCAEVCIVSCCVPACVQAGVSVRVLLAQSFSLQGFLLFSSLLAFLLVLSFSLSVSRFSPLGFLLDGCISCAVGLSYFPQRVFVVLLCQFSVVDLLSPCLDLRPVGFYAGWFLGFLLSNCFMAFQWCLAVVCLYCAWNIFVYYYYYYFKMNTTQARL